MGSIDILSTVAKTISFYEEKLIPKVKNYEMEGKTLLDIIIGFWYYEPATAYEKTENLIIEYADILDSSLAATIRDFYDRTLGFSKSKYGKLTFEVIANITLYLYPKVQSKTYDIIVELIEEYKTLINSKAKSEELINYLAKVDYDSIIAKVMEEDTEKNYSYI